MVSCFLCGLSKTKKNKASGITFHRFPMNPTRRLTWIKQLNINRVPADKSVLCSLHFTKECFTTTTDAVRVKETAVPSIQVNRLKHVKTQYTDIELVPTPILTPINVMVQHQLSTFLMSDHNYAKKTSEVIIDTSLVNPSTPGTSSSSQSYSVQTDDSPRQLALQRTIMDLVRSHTMKSKKIRLLQQTNWRHRKQIKSLKSKILKRKSKNSILKEQGATLINSFGEK